MAPDDLDWARQRLGRGPLCPASPSDPPRSVSVHDRGDKAGGHGDVLRGPASQSRRCLWRVSGRLHPRGPSPCRGSTRPGRGLVSARGRGWLHTDLGRVLAGIVWPVERQPDYHPHVQRSHADDSESGAWVERGQTIQMPDKAS